MYVQGRLQWIAKSIWMDSGCQNSWYHSILRDFIAGAGMEFLVSFFLFDFGLSVVRMPLSSVILRCTPEQLSVTMSLLCRALFGDRDVS